LRELKERKDASDDAAANRLREYAEVADEKIRIDQEPERLNLTQPGEYELFTVLRIASTNKDEQYLAFCARSMIGHLRKYKLLTVGWSNSRGGRLRVRQSLQAESWNPTYQRLGFDPEDENPPFLNAAIEELANVDA